MATPITAAMSPVRRKVAGGKTPNEAMRCLKRRLSDQVYKTMLTDLVTAQKTGPEGQPGNDSVSSATGSQPTTGSSDKSLPGPATDDLTPGKPAHSPGRSRHSPSAPDRRRRQAQSA